MTSSELERIHISFDKLTGEKIKFEANEKQLTISGYVSWIYTEYHKQVKRIEKLDAKNASLSEACTKFAERLEEISNDNAAYRRTIEEELKKQIKTLEIKNQKVENKIANLYSQLQTYHQKESNRESDEAKKRARYDLLKAIIYNLAQDYYISYSSLLSICTHKSFLESAGISNISLSTAELRKDIVEDDLKSKFPNIPTYKKFLLFFILPCFMGFVMGIIFMFVMSR